MGALEMRFPGRQFTILVVDDESVIRDFVSDFFAHSGYVVLTAENGQQGLDVLKEEEVDLLLLDLKMPGMNGLTVLKNAKAMFPDLKVIIQTGFGSIDDAVKAIKCGASDFLEKGTSSAILKSRVGLIYDLWLLEQKNKALRKKEGGGFHYEKLVGESSAMNRLKEMIVRVAPTDATVLIQGDSGTGKEVIAKAIHHHSSRSDGPFVPVDCASLNETINESELFGHVKGAFTSAESATVGLIRSAHTGTLFLDEIGELQRNIQSSLLRTIQERIVRPVGSTKNYPVDIRILAATNRNLLDDVASNKFRQDLYYRLSTVTLSVPPLKDRKDDLPQLADYILNQSRLTDNQAISITNQALEMITRYDWPGNVRELENVLKGAIVFAESDTIQAKDLPEQFQKLQDSNKETLQAGTLASYELEAIKNALMQTNNNRRQAAKILDIAEATLYRKIKQYDL